MSEYIVEMPKEPAKVVRDGWNIRIEWQYKQREEIVRCRDCMKWHHIDTLDGVRYGECDEWKRADSYCVPATRESGFCAWGERKV